MNFFKTFDKTFSDKQLGAAASMTSEFISTDKNIFKVGNKASNILMSLFCIMVSGHAFMYLTRRVRSLLESFFVKFQVFPTIRILLTTVLL